jgi:hypothetical protein
MLRGQFSVAVSFCILLKSLGDDAARVVTIGNCYIYCVCFFVVKYNYVWLLLWTVRTVSTDQSYYSLQLEVFLLNYYYYYYHHLHLHHHHHHHHRRRRHHHHHHYPCYHLYVEYLKLYRPKQQTRDVRFGT